MVLPADAAALTASSAPESDEPPEHVQPVLRNEVEEGVGLFGGQTMTGDGFSPVSSQRAMRSSLQIRAFGLVPGSSSTCAAGLKADITCWAMAMFSAPRRVSRMCGWVLNPVIRRKGGIAASWARSQWRRARFSAPFCLAWP